MNGGTCNDTIPEYPTCLCPENYEGEQCEIRNGECNVYATKFQLFDDYYQKNTDYHIRKLRKE